MNVCCVQSTTTKCTCYQNGMFFSKLSNRNASHVQSFILGTHTILKSSGHCKSKDQTKQECCISNWFSEFCTVLNTVKWCQVYKYIHLRKLFDKLFVKISPLQTLKIIIIIVKLQKEEWEIIFKTRQNYRKRFIP